MWVRFMGRLIEELKRRNVLRAAAFYAAAAWLLVQIATQVFPFFDIPNWAVRLVVVAVIVGFPFALVISWFYELTPSGFKREIEPGQNNADSIWHHRAFRMALFSSIAIALTVMIAAGLVSRRSDTGQAGGISIAVLPFRNLSANAENAYFSEGIQDEILTRLAGIGALRVISRTSTAHYASTPENLPKIAAELGVDNILEGSVQRHDDEVRINVQLIRAGKDTNIWSETYDRILKDVFGVESEVARAVAESLKAVLSGEERRELDTLPTTNPEAYDQYLRGVAIALNSFEPAKLGSAAEFLRRTVELDPAFALAWARLSRVDASLAYQGFDPGAGLCDKAGIEAATALRLKPELGEARLAQGYYYYLCKSDLDQAQAAFEQARLALPGSPAVLEAMGNIERRRGAQQKAAEYFSQAMQLDPRNTELLGNHALTLVELRRFDQARALTDKALDVVPDDPAMIALQVFTYQAEGRIGQAQKLLDLLHSRLQEVDVFDYQVLQLIYQHRHAEAIGKLRQALAQDLGPLGIGAGDYYYLLGVAQRAAGDVVLSRQAFADGRSYLSRFVGAVRSTDNEAYLHAMLCLMDSGRGEVPSAGGDCESVEKVANAGGPFGLSAREALVRAYALRGKSDAVIAALPELLRESYYSYLYSTPLTPALLRQDPVWDGLRADARFRALADAPQRH